MQNLEIKTPLRARAATEARLVELGATQHWTRRQRDTFYRVTRGWMKLREMEGAPAELITYRRDTGQTKSRPSDYDVLPLADAATWHRALARVLDPYGVVAKQRTLWIYEHTRIHLDEVDGLGSFLELETVVKDIDVATARRETAHVITALALAPAAFLAVPYRDLLADKQGNAHDGSSVDE